MSLVGISLFSADDRYEISVAWVSSTDGSTLATTTFSTPSTPSALPAEYQSALSQFPDLVSPESCCVISIPSAFPAGECYDVLRAFTASEITPQEPFPPITHGQAYCATLPHDNDETFIMFLDFSPSSVSSECLLATFGQVDWRRQRRTTLVQRKIATHSNAEDTSFQDALSKVAVSNSEASLGSIVLNNPPPSLSQLIYATLSTLHPHVPITTASQTSISLAAATYEYHRFNLPRPPYRLAQYVVPLPVSIATSAGTAVCLVPHTYRIPVQNQSIILTTSMDDQRSVTARLLLGNHRLAKDNLERAVAVLTGLVPMAKGTARIEVAIDVAHRDGWRETAVVTIQQLTSEEGKGAEDDEEEWDLFARAEKKKVAGLSKTFMFPRFFNDIDDSDCDEYQAAEGNNNEDSDEERLERVVLGDLPV